MSEPRKLKTHPWESIKRSQTGRYVYSEQEILLRIARRLRMTKSEKEMYKIVHGYINYRDGCIQLSLLRRSYALIRKEIARRRMHRLGIY
jgi:hypothetical protein